MTEETVPPDPAFQQVEALRRVFTLGFSAAQIAEPLRSFEGSTPAREIVDLMRQQGIGVVGLRHEGLVIGYFEIPEDPVGSGSDHVLSFDDSVTLTDSAPLDQVVQALDRERRVFVRGFWQIAGVITRHDLQKAPVRMWLFGMLTLIEMRMTSQIEQFYGREGWFDFMSAARLESARRLLAERQRRNQELLLLDCLQFSDKIQIFARSKELRATTVFASRKQLEKEAKLLERLRNNLAHSQDIITTDWEAILGLAESLDRILVGPSRSEK